MIKKYILLILTFLLLPSIWADVEVNNTIITNGNLDANIELIAENDIDMNLYCNGLTCTTNLYDGNLNIPENQTFTFNDYGTDEYKSTGLSFIKLLNLVSRTIPDYINGIKTKYSSDYAWDLFSMLDSIFVTHQEFQPTQYNSNYLAEEVDKLKAENTLLRKYLGIEYNKELLECETGIEKAKRTGLKVTTENGFKIDIEAFGEICIKID